MQLTSSAVNILFSLNRDAAPEKVNATIRPNRAKTAPSTVPRPPRSPSDSFGRRRTPKRRPSSSRSSMPMRRSSAKSRGGMGGSMGGAPYVNPTQSLGSSGPRFRTRQLEYWQLEYVLPQFVRGRGPRRLSEGLGRLEAILPV